MKVYKEYDPADEPPRYIVQAFEYVNGTLFWINREFYETLDEAQEEAYTYVKSEHVKTRVIREDGK